MLRTRVKKPFRYEPSTNPKNTMAEVIPIKPHKVCKALPKGRTMSSPSAKVATHTAPLKNTAQSIGTSNTRGLASRASWPRYRNDSDEVPHYAVTQSRRTALALLRKGYDLLRQELSCAFGFVGQVEGLADLFERRRHRLDVLRPEHSVF
jgi:hypothetical protein